MAEIKTVLGGSRIVSMAWGAGMDEGGELSDRVITFARAIEAAVLAAATPGHGEDRRDAERWRVWIEYIEGSCGNEDARHLEEIMDACRAKALIGLNAIEAALSAAGTRFASVSEQKGDV